MTDDKAREARYTKAIADAYDSAHPFGRAVLPLVDAEVEAATRELRAEVERADERRRKSIRAAQEFALRGARAEAERDQLWAVAEGRILHRFMGNCPDSLDGFDLRDPDCPACAALVQVGAADAAPESGEGR